ncbi:MAG TPA: hypothetical protein VK695_03815 [Steroidobacteraceae bacterium]|jgi:hypothetical protein|nr:hypothetical protein [Steroidobacteraceae bacterium]
MAAATLLLILSLLALSGFADSLGFLYASRIWSGGGAFSWLNLAKSLCGTGIGISLYIVALRPMSLMGVSSAEMQTTVWFAVTIIGVVVLSGRFFTWQLADQLVAVGVVVALGWLLVRTAD